MARPRTAPQAKVLKGNFRPDRDTHGIHVETQLPPCPAWLPKAAKRYWHEIGPELERVGLISLVDGAAFAAHCDSVGKFELATRKLQTLDSMIDSTPQNYHVQSALFTIRNKLWDQVMKSAREFGLTPAGRSQVKPPAQQGLNLGDGWSDFD